MPNVPRAYTSTSNKHTISSQGNYYNMHSFKNESLMVVFESQYYLIFITF